MLHANPPFLRAFMNCKHWCLNIFQRSQIRKQIPSALLPYKPDLFLPVLHHLTLCKFRQILPIHDDPSGGWHFQTSNDIHKRTFSASTLPDDCHQLPAVDRQVKSLQRKHLNLFRLIDFYERIADDQRGLFCQIFLFYHVIFHIIQCIILVSVCQ